MDEDKVRLLIQDTQIFLNEDGTLGFYELPLGGFPRSFPLFVSEAKFEIVNKSADADFIICNYQDDIKRQNNQTELFNALNGYMIINVVRSNLKIL